MSGFRRLPLLSEVISLHSLLGCNWTSQLHQLTLVYWSRFNGRHLLTTSVVMLLPRWCFTMSPHCLPTSMVSVMWENVRNMQFEPPSQENAPLTQFAFIFES